MKTLMRAAAPAALAVMLLTGAGSAALAQSAPTAAESMFRATTLNLSAYGEVKAAPDMATISLGVMTEAATASDAMAQNRVQMTRVIAALRKAGVAEKDIQTSNLNLSPRYAYVDNQPPKLTGYQASNQVTITVNDLARLGSAIDATVSAGANQMNGVSFGLKDPSGTENQARLSAVKALQAKADLYAGATGHRIGRLVTLSEGGGYTPSPPPMPYMAMRAEKMDSTPIQAGQLTVRVDVTGMYELTR